MSGRRLPWLALVVVLAVALGVGARSGGGPATEEARVERVASTLKCPTCRSIAVADSDAPASQAIRDEIARQVREGKSDAEIRASLVDRYGKDILLKPESSGVGALAWALPVVATVLGFAGLACAFARWRRLSGAHAAPTDADRALVERALSPPEAS